MAQGCKQADTTIQAEEKGSCFNRADGGSCDFDVQGVLSLYPRLKHYWVRYATVCGGTPAVSATDGPVDPRTTVAWTLATAIPICATLLCTVAGLVAIAFLQGLGSCCPCTRHHGPGSLGQVAS